MGDIIPNQVTFKFRNRTNNTESPQNIENFKLVELVIIAVLDMYLDCKCDEFTTKQTEEIDKLGIIMEPHLNVL